MKHLFSFSVFQQVEDLPGNGDGLKDIGCDGVELFTMFTEVPQVYKKVSPAVHLPYATDWYSGWMGLADTEEFDEENVKHILYGRDRDEIVRNIRSAIESASAIEPAYGVIHAGNADLKDLKLNVKDDNSREVLRVFCEMMNRAVSGFKKGEPPFKLAFENLWWPGLKLLDPWEYEFMRDRLEFDNWGFCLDTGHMMNTFQNAYSEEECVRTVLDTIGRYPDEMKERIGTVHLHLSTSAEYRKTLKIEGRRPGETAAETITRIYPHITKIDQHRPFSTDGCRRIVDEISPDFVTHEMMRPTPEQVVRDFLQQRAFFPG